MTEIVVKSTEVKMWEYKVYNYKRPIRPNQRMVSLYFKTKENMLSTKISLTVLSR